MRVQQSAFSNYTLVQDGVASLSFLKYLLNLKCRDPKRLRLDGWTRHDSMFIPEALGVRPQHLESRQTVQSAP